MSDVAPDGLAPEELEPQPATLLRGARLVAPWVGMLSLLCLTVGALVALFWANSVELATWVVTADGSATMSQSGWTSIVASDAVFAGCALLVGPGIGYVTWRWFESLGWPVAVLAAGAGLLAGVVCWQLGAVMGPGPFAERIAAASPGDSVPVALELHALAALALWPFAAVVSVMIASALTWEPNAEDEAESAGDVGGPSADDTQEIRRAQLDVEAAAAARDEDRVE